MAVEFKAMSSLLAPCKVCQRPAALFGVVDFNKCCEDGALKRFGLCGVPVYYHRCNDCGFIFTTAFDQFSAEDFRTHIYNDQYIRADPEYLDIRPRRMAQGIAQYFGACRSMRVLDYGAGSGLLAQCLRESGFSDVHSFDPLVPAHAARPAGLFDLIFSVEVVEHSTAPLEILADIVSFMADPGLIFLSTRLQPADIQTVGGAWWYLAPRNGHVSLHSQRSLVLAASRVGCRAGSFDEANHCMFKAVPPWARHFLQPNDAAQLSR